MPIAPLLAQAAFDSETTRVLTTAFDQAWEKVKASGSPLGEDDSAASTRELLAKRIIETGRRGERDVARLVEDALKYVASLNQKREN